MFGQQVQLTSTSRFPFGKGSNSPDLSGRLLISWHLSWSPNFATILPINEVTYHFLVFCSFVEIFYFSVFICLSAFTSRPFSMSKLVILLWSPICTSTQQQLHNRNPSVLKSTHLLSLFFCSNYCLATFQHSMKLPTKYSKVHCTLFEELCSCKFYSLYSHP